ncbi:MAG: tetratricopeptide repeat protein [Desulfobulbaceae bacterium]|nr:tetratricopeptide repeat protein [Desulfobulbaceae bacterium]
MLRKLCCSAFLLCLCVSCAAVPNPDATGQPISAEAGKASADTGCAYFYFLWGRAAEADHHYADALAAYEKALACDPGAEYLMRGLVVFYMRMNRNDDASRLIGRLLQLHPQDVEILTLKAGLYVSEGKVDEAAAVYNAILALTPRDGNTLLRLGTLYAGNNRFKEARKVLERLVNLDDRSFVGYQYLAKLYRQLGEYDKAMTAYDKALALNWVPALALEAVDILEYRKHYEKAISFCRRILDNEPEDEQARQRLVQVLLGMGEVGQALDELRELRRYSGNEYDVDLTIGRILIEQEQYDQAISHFSEMLAADPESGNIHYLLALAHGAKGESGEAIRLLHHVKPADSAYEDAVLLLVELLVKEEQLAEAETALTAAIADPVARRPRFYGALAALYRRLERNDEGRKVFAAALPLYPQDAMLHYEYALFLDRTGSVDEALAAMQKVLAIDPHNPYALNYIGYTWADRGENLAEARRYIEEAVALRPDDGFIRDSLGWVYFKLGEGKRAVAELTRALELAPDPVIFEHLGDVHAKAGRAAEAIKAYGQALELLDKDDDRQRLEGKIKTLRGGSR